MAACACWPPGCWCDGNACHEPHGSKSKALLRGTTKQLCASCHADVGKGDHVHQPVADGECLTCHDAHGGPAAPALVKAVPALCADCHEGASADMKSRHRGMDVSGANCLNCHSAHESKAAALRPEHTHPGFAEGQCTKCHSGASPSKLNLIAPVAVNAPLAGS